MTLGIRPAAGFALIDGTWARALSDGNNDTYTSGITAHAGGTQAAGFQLPDNVSFMEVDTVASGGDSVLLPYAQAGQRKFIFNNGAQTLDIYAQSTNNPATGSADVINKTTNVTAYTLTSGQAAIFWCAKNGVWAANKTA